MNPLTQFKKIPILPLLIALALVAVAAAGAAQAAINDFNANGYVLENASTRQTAIWDLNNNVFVSGAYGPTLPADCTLLKVFAGGDCAGCWDC